MRLSGSFAGVLLAAAALFAPRPAEAIPVFAHRYGLSCQACHTEVPHLTAFGQTFLANGYRIPGLAPKPVFPAAVRVETSYASGGGRRPGRSPERAAAQDDRRRGRVPDGRLGRLARLVLGGDLRRRRRRAGPGARRLVRLPRHARRRQDAGHAARGPVHPAAPARPRDLPRDDPALRGLEPAGGRQPVHLLRCRRSAARSWSATPAARSAARSRSSRATTSRPGWALTASTRW